MNKYLKNVTDETINLIGLGIDLEPDDEIEICHCVSFKVIQDELFLDLIREGSIQVGNGLTYFSDEVEGEIYLRSNFDDSAFYGDDSSIDKFTPSIVQDTTSGKKATTLFMSILKMMKELYNYSDNPIYDENFQKFIGTGGREQDHLSRTSSIETEHEKHGWHRDECRSWGTQKPLNFTAYGGYLNSFNYAVNNYVNEAVAQDFAKYNLIALNGDIQNPSHADYSNTEVIIPRIQALNPDTKIFGHVSLNQSAQDCMDEIDQWVDLGVDGIFLDNAGYEYGKTRAEFNSGVDYIHDQGLLCFVNAWNINHVLGTENDTSYPNSTYNPDLLESNLTENDYIYIERFAVDTTSYGGGYETKTEWYNRGTEAIEKRNTYGINLVGGGIIDNSSGSGQSLFNFLYISACMFALEGVGSTDTSYGSSTSTITFWTRPDVSSIGKLWVLNPVINLDVTDSDVYHRYTEFSKMSLDFSSGAELSSITKY